MYEIDHRIAFGPCSTHDMTPTSLLVCVEYMAGESGDHNCRVLPYTAGP